jgi:hypothetical protein
MTHPNAPAILAVDRRTTLRWLAAAMATGSLSACGQKPGGIEWAELVPIKAPGIGKDPNLLEPIVPWPLTLTRAELAAAAAVSDFILPAEGDAPAPSQVGVPAFIDEWVSAPYPDQHRDRQLIVPGLAWIDRESYSTGNTPFASASSATQAAILDRIAWKDRVEPGLEKPAEFFTRMRALTLGAYYTTPEGWADIGYPGAKPTTGPYPGPTPEALEHIKGVIESMGLTFTPP